MILVLNLSLVVVFLLILTGNLWVLPSRVSAVLSLVISTVRNILSIPSKVSSVVFSSLFYYLLFLNLLSNLPFCSSPSLYYYFSFTLSFIFWGSCMYIVFKRSLGSFISHLMPYGAPMFLSIILPVIELFSQLIRPLTLMIRLRTNLSAGHIMLYIFSLFSLSSSVAFFSIFILSSLLMILEVCISVLQAYIFVSLSHIYFVETV